MSRIGKKPVNIPAGVKVKLEDNLFTCTGPKGSVSKKLPEKSSVAINDSVITVSLADNDKNNEKFTGLTRTIIANCIEGVSDGFSLNMEIIGVGYKAEVKTNALNLNIGYSHPIIFNIPESISISVEKNTLLKITGNDKDLVGQVAAKIRSYRKPEPYKGKGIKYSDEIIKRKVGKASGK
ncbi:MAG: 50S ribosomal protein L6 [Candidatus Acididesulfobacter diazotrophicus]|jgi:large subunit ribosomal protein L6|uniref:Large ribosomal subunit protein uL6 n=1 Tax=Candidatus Acididesulfobacter diazotrophicus TaxID=2597226 RepID=A0A519BQ30_9DELT|nr:MAG: 50S ribosomal protein L6 [Candidatus Acididesulfobacter diazotrophicus]